MKKAGEGHREFRDKNNGIWYARKNPNYISAVGEEKKEAGVGEGAPKVAKEEETVKTAKDKEGHVDKIKNLIKEIRIGENEPACAGRIAEDSRGGDDNTLKPGQTIEL